MTVLRYHDYRPLDRRLVAALHAAHYASAEYEQARAFYADATARLLAAERERRAMVMVMVMAA